MKLSLLEKIGLVVTGIGIPLVVYNHYKQKDLPPGDQFNLCPYCKQYVQGPIEVYGNHVARCEYNPRRLRY